LPWPADADLDPYGGIQLLHETSATLTAPNVLGFPSVAVPTGVSDGLPTGVQVMSDLWREDICLAIAQVIEQGSSMPTPINPC
jgi:amidase